jgi:hypothetical protein
MRTSRSMPRGQIVARTTKAAASGAVLSILSAQNARALAPGDAGFRSVFAPSRLSFPETSSTSAIADIDSNQHRALSDRVLLIAKAPYHGGKRCNRPASDDGSLTNGPLLSQNFRRAAAAGQFLFLVLL